MKYFYMMYEYSVYYEDESGEAMMTFSISSPDKETIKRMVSVDDDTVFLPRFGCIYSVLRKYRNGILISTLW